MTDVELRAHRAPYGPDEIQSARVLFARPVEFTVGAAAIDGLPPTDLPEVAFAGRSNVGKSSLLNALVGRRALARASTAPGRTREVNFFLLDGRVRLVDLPGYGFARAPRGAAHRFQTLARAYLRGRSSLKRVYVLIDARRGLMSTDEETLEALDQAAVSYQLVLAKADKLTPSALEVSARQVLTSIQRRPAAFPRVVVTSARTGQGIANLRVEVACAVLQ